MLFYTSIKINGIAMVNHQLDNKLSSAVVVNVSPSPSTSFCPGFEPKKDVGMGIMYYNCTRQFLVQLMIHHL